MAKDYTINVTINGKDNASPVMKKVGTMAQKWLKLAATAAIAATVAFGTMSAKWGMDFDKQMSGVQAVSQATAAEMAALSEKAKQLGRDSAYSASQSGQAMEELLKSGLSVNDTLASVDATLDLAASGTLELAEAAKIAAQAMNIFSLPASETSHVADVLAQAASSAATDVHAIGEAMQYAGPVASGLNVPLEETVAVVSLMAKAGIEASMAGTTFRNILTSLVNPTGEAQAALDNLGIKTIDASGQFLSITEMLNQFTPEILNTAEGVAQLNKIFGERGAPGMIQLVKSGAGSFVEFRDALRNADGAAKEMAETRLDNLSGAFTLLKSSIEGVGIALTTGGANSLNDRMKVFITESVIPMINAFSQWIEQIGGLPGLLSMTWEILVAWVTRVRDAFMMLGDWEIFKTFMINLGIMLGGALLSIAQFLGNAILAVGDIAKVIWLPLVTPFAVVVSQIKEMFGLFLNWIGPKFYGLVNAMIDPFRGLLAKMGIEINDFEWTPLTVEPALTMKEAWAASWQAVGDGLKQAKDRMSGAGKDLIENLKAVGSVGAETAAMLGLSNEDFAGDVADIVEKYKELNAQIQAIPDNLDDAGKPADDAGDDAVKASLTMTEALTTGWKRYVDNIPKFIDQVVALVEHMGLAIERALAGTFETYFRTGTFTIKNFVRTVRDEGISLLAGMAAGVIMSFLTNNERIAQLSGAAWAAAASVANAAWTVLSWIGSFTVDVAASAAGAAWAAGAAVATAAWTTLKWIGSFSASAAASAAGAAWAAGAAVATAAWTALKWIGSFVVGDAAKAAGHAWAAGATVATTAWALLKWIGSFPVSAAASAAGAAWAAGAAVATAAWTALKWIESFSASAAASAAGAAWAAGAVVATTAWAALKWIGSISVEAVAKAAGLAWAAAAAVAEVAWAGVKALISSIPNPDSNTPSVPTPSTPTDDFGDNWMDYVGIAGGILGWAGFFTSAANAFKKKHKAPPTPEELFIGVANEWYDYIISQRPGLALPENKKDLLVQWMLSEWKNNHETMESILERFSPGGSSGYWYNEEPLENLKKFHSGGLISGEGLFLGLSEEGVLNRRAMRNIGVSGLDTLNRGGTIGKTIVVNIQAWDGEDVRRAFEDQVIPMIMEKSEAGVEVIHERGIRQVG